MQKYAYLKSAATPVIPSAKRVGDLIVPGKITEMPDGRGGLGITRLRFSDRHLQKTDQDPLERWTISEETVQYPVKLPAYMAPLHSTDAIH